jgi:hypothetical protein
MRTQTKESYGRRPASGALLRLLEYVHREVSENLQDRRCAEQLEFCIEHVKEECVL